VLRVARKYNWRIAHAGLDLRADPTYQLFAEGHGVLGLRHAIPQARTWRGKGPEHPDPFKPRESEFLVAGRSGASVLKNSTLDPYLRNNDIRTLLLMGFATHVCVESTLREAHDLGYNAILVHDACAAFEKTQHTHVRENVVPHFGREISAQELITHMRAAERVLP
jgi:nicotinamidase-related amidase